MSAVLVHPQRHRVDVQEYLRMAEAGVFGPEARLELIEGEIIEMAPIGSWHAGVVNRLNRLFNRLAGGKALVSVQNPLIVGKHSVPQPDLALLKPRADDYLASHPTADEVLLVIEVADCSLDFDTGTKVPLYARAGIVEAWVVDVEERVTRVFRDPNAKGYRTSTTVSGKQKLATLALPQVAISAAAAAPSCSTAT